MKLIILNSKGGVGKSFFTKLLFLFFDRLKKVAYFIDCDNASASTTKFFKSIGEKKGPHIFFKSENLLGTGKQIDRTKFDIYLSELEALENVVSDFGADSANQLLVYLQEEYNNGILDVFEELGIKFLLVIAGGGSIKESIEFTNELKKIPGIEKHVIVVGNEYFGGVNGQSVKEYTNADIQITALTDDHNSEAQKEWNGMLNSGTVYADIESMPTIRKRRVVNYLDSIFSQFEKVTL